MKKFYLIASFLICCSFTFGASFEETKRKAEQGYANAQHNLGVMYTKGEGVLKDSVEAVKWYRKSAEQGNALAQFGLGFMYDKGEDVLKDEVEAYAWSLHAAINGISELKNMLEKKIDGNVRFAGQQRAKELQAIIEKNKKQ